MINEICILTEAYKSSARLILKENSIVFERISKNSEVMMRTAFTYNSLMRLIEREFKRSISNLEEKGELDIFTDENRIINPNNGGKKADINTGIEFFDEGVDQSIEGPDGVFVPNVGKSGGDYVPCIKNGEGTCKKKEKRISSNIHLKAERN